jgi:hypothetical protein
MKAVLHYTRQFAQILSLPKHQPPPDRLAGLGDMQFKRIAPDPDNMHHHYWPVGAPIDGDCGVASV